MVPFLRAREGSFPDALFRSFRSARGIYDDGVYPPDPDDYPCGYPYPYASQECPAGDGPTEGAR